MDNFIQNIIFSTCYIQKRLQDGISLMDTVQIFFFVS